MDAFLVSLPNLACVVLGLVLLVWGADRFIAGATAIAIYANISPLIIGMVVVGFATSAPEYLVSLVAAINGSVGLSFGNVFGSNITNIGLGLGIPALFSAIAVTQNVVRKELPILIVSTLLVIFILWDGTFSRMDGIVLLGVFFGIMYSSITVASRAYKKTEKKDSVPEFSKKMATVWLLVGFGILLGGSQILVFGATGLAKALGISDLIVGLTVVAVGTSLPEIASSCIAVIRGETEMAFGNIIGSNLFNLLLVLGTVGVISPVEIGAVIVRRDGVVMLLFAILLFLLIYKKGSKLTRVKGLVLVLLYVVYTVLLVLSELSPDKLPFMPK